MTHHRNQSAFTLIDMMIAVAILGILAAIAYPQISKMKARGVQLAAKTELSAIYVAQKNFREYYKTFSADWQLAGFIPKGMALTGLYPTTIDRDRAYGLTGGAATAPMPTTALALGLPSGLAWPLLYPAYPGRCRIVGNDSAATDPNVNGADLALTGPKAFVSKTTFLASAIGCPVKNLTTTTGLDRWQIDQNAVITQPNNGL